MLNPESWKNLNFITQNRMECTVGTRSLRHVFTPGFTFQIDTEKEGQVTRHTFQADYPSVRDAVSTLKSALQVGDCHCVRKVPFSRLIPVT